MKSLIHSTQTANNLLFLRAMRLLTFHTALILAVLFIGVDRTFAQSINLKRPGERDFIVDKANLLSETDEESLKSRCDKLLTETATPIIIVTIESMSKYSNYRDMRIETFAHLLFDQWEIGHVEVDGKPRNDGILLLVSKDDRKARIQFGAGWGRAYDNVAQRIINGKLIPHFKKGDFAGGIVSGVSALGELARAGLESTNSSNNDNSRQDSTTPPNVPGEYSLPRESSSPRRQVPPPFSNNYGPSTLVGTSPQLCFFGLPIIIILILIASKAFGGSMYKGGRYNRNYGGFFGYHNNPSLWNRHHNHNDNDNNNFFSGGGGGFGGSGFGGGGGFSGGSFGGGFSGGGSSGGGYSGGGGASGSW